MPERKYYSLRTGQNPKVAGFNLEEFRDLFFRLYTKFFRNGYFDEAFGFFCHDNDIFIDGKVIDPEYEIILKIRKKNIWGIEDHYRNYSEDDLFDVIEFLYDNISKPIDSTTHGWNNSCTHWETFNKYEGQKEFREEINVILDLYINRYTLSNTGEILHSPEEGFEKIFEADIPSDDDNIKSDTPRRAGGLMSRAASKAAGCHLPTQTA
jgi:hypothetical protein